MTLPDPKMPDAAATPISHLGIVPSRVRDYDGEDVQGWILAGWITVALTGLFIGIPVAIAFGMPGVNAVMAYLALNVAGFFAYMLGLDAYSTNLLYGRKTPSAYHTARDYRRVVSIVIQVTMTIAALESLWLAGMATTAKFPLKPQTPSVQAAATK